MIQETKLTKRSKMIMAVNQQPTKIEEAREQLAYSNPWYKHGNEWLWLEDGLVRIADIESTSVNYFPASVGDADQPAAEEWNPYNLIEFQLHMQSGSIVGVLVLQIWEERTFNDLRRAITGVAS